MHFALVSLTFSINCKVHIVFNGSVYRKGRDRCCLVRLVVAGWSCSVWQCQVSNCENWMDVGLLLRKLKRSQPLSASGMRSIVSFSSLGYLAVIQSTLPWSWPPIPNTSAGPWQGGDSPVNNHNVLLYCPNKHQTIRHRESAGWQHFEKSGNRASMEVRRCPILVWSWQTRALMNYYCYVPLNLQIFLWEQNLEQFHMDLFRFRCYLASLQGGELPNPKRLLAFASRPTKLAMGRLGIFSVSSFHALVNILFFIFAAEANTMAYFSVLFNFFFLWKKRPGDLKNVPWNWLLYWGQTSI